ncbi:glycine betaine ABC transporter substrate-binding protein [Camelliibacillus cellulosilyticus]|uniref:Glycine betaine ABC transporter substrate-binding protein n=1 Tax=Camelliibacillus cellulosilyticus TaxID=2174486 RepID=A0ABV9GM94_9BACL
MSFLLLTVVAIFGFALTGCGSNNASGGSSSGGGKSVGDQVNNTITGIDPGAGIMQSADKALKDYGLDQWQVQSSSESTMMAQLKKAYAKKQPIVITGWSPHWMFAQYDLKYLKDPKHSFGQEEEIRTVAHKGFSSEHPNAAKFFKQFQWTEDDMNDVMLNIEKGKEPADAAKEWVDQNQDLVKKWTDGVEKVSGKKLSIAYVAWSSEVASTAVVKNVLESYGYKVTLQQVDAAPMWAAVAKGSADVTLSAWLPVTHEAYYKKYKDQVEVLHTNLKGTKLGLVVPKYMKDVNSIEDLKK